LGLGTLLHPTKSIYLVAFLWGMILFGMIVASICLSSYAIDSYRENATEIFIMAIVFKNFFLWSQ
jgi:hypothetical protein